MIVYHVNLLLIQSLGNLYKHGLTYRAGMFIDDVLWSILKWSSFIDRGPIRLHGDTGNVKNDIQINTR